MAKRRFLIGAVGLVKGNVREDSKAMVSICDEIEPYFENNNYLENVSFDSISLIFRYTEDRAERIEIGRLNKRFSELEVAYEIPMNVIRKMPYDALRNVFREAALDVIIEVAKKYNLPTKRWIDLKKDMEGEAAK